MSGPSDQSRAALVQAFEAARARDDVPAMTGAALELASTSTFGFQPGRAPAFLHEVYQRSDGEQRTRIAAALARTWVYGGDPQRAVPFAAEAVREAETYDDPGLLAEALDAQLLVHWGPDDLDARVRITLRLEDVVSHLAAVEPRMNAYLWRVTTALECLDLVALHRQLRALDQLAAESASPRVEFFARSRDAMHALLVGDADRAAALSAVAVEAGERAGEADASTRWMAKASAIARQRGDRTALAAEADLFDLHGRREGVVSICAESAMLWLDAGDAEAAGQVLERLAGSGFGYLSRDVDWLLTVATLTEVAARLGRAEVAREGIALLEPYAGRAVVNAGGVGFVGVVDDYLAAAARTVGRDDAALRWAKTATACYQRIGATWWLNRLTASPAALPSAVRSTMAFRRAGDGLWQIGPLQDAVMLREMKGFGYVQQLLQHPGVEIGALQLSDWAAGHPGAGVAEGAADDVIDRRALQAYRSRLAAIDIELDAADRAGDAGRSERLRAERDAVLGEVQSATGLGGRLRQSGSSQERARVAVRKAVAAAIERVAAHDPALGRLLADCIDTGRTCRYRADPARPVEWLLT